MPKVDLIKTTARTCNRRLSTSVRRGGAAISASWRSTFSSRASSPAHRNKSKHSTHRAAAAPPTAKQHTRCQRHPASNNTTLIDNGRKSAADVVRYHHTHVIRGGRWALRANKRHGQKPHQVQSSEMTVMVCHAHAPPARLAGI